MTSRLPLVAVALLSGCIVGDGKYKRPYELDVASEVDRVRILAVQAEPPEARPGEIVRFTALVPDPQDEVDILLWLACPPSDAGGYGCSADLGALGGEPTPEELREAGVIGIEPGLPPEYVPPVDLLDGLDERGRREGLNVTVQLAAFPQEAITDTAGSDFFNEVEVGYKRLVVSEAPTPNHNPVITGFDVDALPIPDGIAAEVDAGQQYDLGITIALETVETYEYLNSDGVIESRTEEPYATWYCTDGQLLESVTLHPHTQATWLAPDEPGAVTCWAVVRDRRGGIAWRELPLTIR